MNDDDVTEVRRWHRDIGSSHVSCLRWLRTVGFASHDGVSMSMYEQPAIAGDDIEFLGGNRGSIDGRDMTPDEVRDVRVLLRRMAGEARDAMCGFSSLVIADL